MDETVPEVAIFPVEDETRAKSEVRFAVVTLEAAPVMFACFSLSSSESAAWTLVAAIFPHATLVICPAV